MEFEVAPQSPPCSNVDWIFSSLLIVFWCIELLPVLVVRGRLIVGREREDGLVIQFLLWLTARQYDAAQCNERSGQ